MKRFDVMAIGPVESALTDLDSAPRQADEGAPEACLVFEPEMLEALRSLRPGDEVIGLHRVEITAVDGRRLRVRQLEAVDGTPILDVKPVLSEDIGQR